MTPIKNHEGKSRQTSIYRNLKLQQNRSHEHSSKRTTKEKKLLYVLQRIIIHNIL